MSSLRPWFVFSILSLGLSGFFALLVALSRTPIWYRFLPADYFHYALVGHVDLSIVLWLIGFIHLLWNKFFYIEKDGATLILSYAGLVLLSISVLFKVGNPVPNNYIPVLNHPIFLSGLILFLLAFSYKVVRLSAISLKNLTSPDGIKGNLSIGVLTGLIMSLSFFLSPFIIEKTDDLRQLYERVFWIPGHIEQFLYGAILISLWYYLLDIEKGRVKLGILRFAGLAFPFTSFVLLLSQFLFPDPLIKEARFLILLAFGAGLGIPIFLHIFFILRWFRPSFSIAGLSLSFSLILYILGVIIAYLGLKEEDLRIPAHYHGAITALTMALMGISYYSLEEMGLRPVSPKKARLQSMIFGAGMVLFVIGLYLAGRAGAPRKTFGATIDDPVAIIGLSVMGIGSLFAVVGGILFVWNMITSLYGSKVIRPNF